MEKSSGRVTVPTDDGFVDQTLEIMERWGADAVRNCDGTDMPRDIGKHVKNVYTTYFLTRGDQQWAHDHPDELQELYLMSRFCTAEDTTLDIPIMEGYFSEQVRPDTVHEPAEWWEVIDRTTGAIVPPAQWEYVDETETVRVRGVTPYHEYTASFLAYAIWDPTQMYNHITNNWGDKPHEMPYDARLPKTREHILSLLDGWLDENPETTVVRFTTFFYHFTLVFNSERKEKFVDWFGYSSSVSPTALEAFEQERGYRLRPEDFVDEGYYNSSFRVPTSRYLDYVDFQSRFVCGLAKQCVELVHKRGKQAMMFLGDNWIATEPYGDHFAEIGIDAVVGSVGSASTLRLISDIPHVKYTEGRFLPYFFPDIFRESGDPVGEARTNWLTARRAILRKPVDRIGYGGYIQLAAQFPEFIDYVERVCNEFREIYDNIGGTKPWCAPFKVAVLNSWGRLRSWSTHMVAHGLWYKQIYSYLGVIESLAGMAFDVSFISFGDIRDNPGLLDDIGVIINAGDAGTAFSGGEEWGDERIVSAVRGFVMRGGGLVGIGQPTAYQKNGRYFQLAGALGVDQELGFSLSTRRYNKEERPHFITEGLPHPIGFGEGMKNVYAMDGAQVIIAVDGDVQLASNSYGKGRGVYISGLPYSPENSRLLLRAVYWAAGKDNELNRWFSENPATECNAYPDKGCYSVVNNSDTPQKTVVYDGAGDAEEMTLDACEIRWLTADYPLTR